MKVKKLLLSVFSMDAFKALFFIVSILGVCPFLGGPVTPFLKLFHIYGLAVIAVDLFHERRILKNQGRILLVLFAASYCMTLLTNRELLNFSDLSNFAYLLLALGIVYSYGEKSEKATLISANIICVLISVANAVGVALFYIKTCIYVHPYGYIGSYIHENRLCGLLGNPNVLGMVSLAGIAISAVLFYFTRKKYSFVYLIAGFINLLALLLSNSRTQIYSFVFGCAVFVFLIFLKGKINFKAFLMSATAAILAALLVFSGCKLIQVGLAACDFRYGYYMRHIEGGEEVHSKYPLPRPDEDDEEGFEGGFGFGFGGIIDRENTGLNGRPELWAAGLKILKAFPLFGAGLDNHNNALQKLNEGIITIGGNLHNVYLDLLACCGIVGFICLALYLLMMLKRLKNFFKYNNGENWEKGAVLTAIILAFILDGVADSTLIASFYPTAVSFWFFASMLAQQIEKENKRTGNYHPELLWRLIGGFFEKNALKNKKEPLKVLHYVTKMDRAGQETFIMNLMRKVDTEKLHFNFLCTDPTPADYDEEIKSLGGEIYYTAPITARGPLKQLQKVFILKNALLKNGCDVFHIHTHHAMDAFSNALAAKWAGVRIVCVHSHNTSVLYHEKAHKLFRHLLPLLNIRRFACSTAAGEWMFTKPNFKVLYNGLDTNEFCFNPDMRNAIRAQMGWEGKQIIGHIGRFNEQKNHRFLIEIFAALHKAQPNTHLVLIGKGELENEIREKVTVAGLDSAVEFLGIRDDVRALYQGMDLFLFPSLFEGLPVVLVEAQATDLPCLISDTITPDAIINNKTTVHSLGDTAENWAAAAVKLLNDTTRGDNREIILSAGYDIADLAEKLDKIYLGCE